jgi:hypothetical protein
MPTCIRRTHSQIRLDAEHQQVTHTIEGHSMLAFRHNSDEDRQLAMVQQGYQGDDAVWQSLRDHEVLHVMFGEWFVGGPSLVLLHEAGVRQIDYHDRMYEEAIVLAFQVYLNHPYRSPQALWPFRTLLESWTLIFERVMQSAESCE